MPIVDVELVLAESQTIGPGLSSRLADALGQFFHAAPGRVWVRLRTLPATHYAENAADLAAEELPLFVNVLFAHPIEGEARANQATGICEVVARATGRLADRVHLVYEPPAAGRVAFGGRLVG